ncbi:MAG: S46 family peptidase [Acidobacteriia bacterium]|nr:S46 family peptidase [Terriglobia bacterium]
MTIRTWLQWTACLAAAAAMALADEGKWTPQQVLQLDAAWLRQQGLELPVSRLWDPQRGTGLLAATVSTGGCSAGFVSATGLMLTNHHCLFGVIQENSRPDRDLITNGFLARTPEEELRGTTTRVTVPRKFTDVTREMESAIPAGAGDLARAKAIETKQKALVAACEKTPGARCSVAAFEGGLQYVLVESFELTDIRLVYAPPRAIGEFGGEPDNFRWPRHTGDFAMARAYQDGKPYHPEFFFPISRAGVKAGDFVMVLGYPGRTMRSLTAGEMANERDYRFRLRAEVYGEWIGLLEESTKGRAQGSIAVAATLKSLNNTHTNALGQLAGMARGRIVEKQQAQDGQVMAWAEEHKFAGAVEAKKELDRLAEESRRSARHDFLLQAIPSGPLALKQATTLVRLAAERAKPDAEREGEFMERQLARLRATLEREQKSFYQPADEALLAAYVERALKLGAGERIAAIDERFRGVSVGEAVARLYAATKVTDASERLKMFAESTEQLRARQDALLDLAFALEPELRAWQTAARTRDGALARLRPEWRRAVIAHAGKPVAPDANSTLRVSFAHIAGYVPRDGVFYTPQTTLAGMIEKHTGEEPFAVPAIILEAARRVKPEQIPLDFLSNADTTGGNSGSPVVNGRGELVGLNFDRVWENVANDFGYNPEIARNVSVDIRFFLWLLEDVQKADNILRELGVKR